MKIKFNPMKLSVFTGIAIMLFSTFSPTVTAFTVEQQDSKDDSVSLNIKQIKNLNNLFKGVVVRPTDVLAQTLVSVLEKDEVGDHGVFTVKSSVHDILKYTYPTASDDTLDGLTITPIQAVNWLHHVGYTATLLNRSLTTQEIKNNLDNSSPIIPILSNQNKENWLNSCTAGVLYAHDDVNVGQEKMNKSFIEAINLGDAEISDNEEQKPFSFQEQLNQKDPLQASDKFVWSQTITDIKQDPSSSNSKTIKSSVKAGIFNAKSTSSGLSSEVTFTDPFIEQNNSTFFGKDELPIIKYSTHVNKKGWSPEVQTGRLSGPEGQNLGIDSLKLSVSVLPKGETGGIAYSTYVQGKGWQPESSDGKISGMTDKGSKIEAIKMRLTGSLANRYTLYYTLHVDKKGWIRSKDNEIAGAIGSGLNIQSILINLVEKKVKKAPSEETKQAAVALINLYEDSNNQKTTNDLEKYLNISSNDVVSSKQIMNWFRFLGLDFDTQEGRFSKQQSMNQSNAGKLYFTFLKATKAPDNIQNFGAIGMGYINNSMSYSPKLSFVKYPFSPGTSWVHRPNETGDQKTQLAKLSDRMKSYDYDAFNTSDELGKPISEYQEEVTIYNIRSRGESSTSTPSSPPAEQGTVPNSSEPSNASYHPLKNFFIHGTQGKTPWCSEYITAESINVLNKAPETAPLGENIPWLTAAQVMQSYFPSASEEQLKSMSGGSIENCLQVMNKKYNVTADVEDRTLNFQEVKKELDAGSLIQMDSFDTNNKSPQGSPENTGHSLAIVGYVMPADGDINTHPPYYEVWNPWWNVSFYVSSKSPYINLDGAHYSWKRTWHNWKKTNNISASLNSDISKQKVTQSMNPNYLDNNKLVANFEEPDKLVDLYKSGTVYTKCFSNDNKRIQISINDIFIDGLNQQNNGFGNFATDFEKTFQDTMYLNKTGITAIPASYYAAVLTIMTKGKGVLGLPVLKGIFDYFNIKVSLKDFTDAYREYNKDINNLNKDFVAALNETQGKS